MRKKQTILLFAVLLTLTLTLTLAAWRDDASESPRDVAALQENLDPPISPLRCTRRALALDPLFEPTYDNFHRLSRSGESADELSGITLNLEFRQGEAFNLTRSPFSFDKRFAAAAPLFDFNGDDMKGRFVLKGLDKLDLRLGATDPGCPGSCAVGCGSPSVGIPSAAPSSLVLPRGPVSDPACRHFCG